MTIVTLQALNKNSTGEKMKERYIPLPQPDKKGKVSIEEVLSKRRSIRNYLNEPIKLSEITQLLWAAQGITANDGRRASPSAGATYPIEIYLANGSVIGLNKGLYKYIPEKHSLQLIYEKDLFFEICKSTYQIELLKRSAGLFIITAIPEKTTSVYAERGFRYIYMEAGHIGENIALQGVSLGIGTVMIGAFDDHKLSEILKLNKGEIPLYIIPIGKTDKYN